MKRFMVGMYIYLFDSGTYEYLSLKIPYRMTMGIEPLDMEDWIEVDVFYDEEMALRREILESRKAVAIVSRPEAAEANWEVLEMLADFLPRRFPARFRREGSLLCNLTTEESFNISDQGLDPLDAISRLIQVHVLPHIHDIDWDIHNNGTFLIVKHEMHKKFFFRK